MGKKGQDRERVKKRVMCLPSVKRGKSKEFTIRKSWAPESGLGCAPWRVQINSQISERERDGATTTCFTYRKREREKLKGERHQD